MRKYLIVILFFFNQLAEAQVMMPALHAVLTKALSMPTISTTAITSATSTSGVSGGNITNDGGAPITSRGICWDTSPNPTVGLATKTNDGSGLGSFSSSISGLASGTVYYVRSYGVNTFGTGYGSERSFIALAIGDSYQGGKLAYVLASGDPGYDADMPHGLVANTYDQSLVWGKEGFTVSGADGTAIGTGLQNTIDIIASDPIPGNAARVCRGMTINGYSDWYLPSKDELNKLYLNRALIGGFNPTGWYFSSTESSSVYAWYQNFSNGDQAGIGAHKDWALSVRAIRSF